MCTKPVMQFERYTTIDEMEENNSLASVGRYVEGMPAPSATIPEPLREDSSKLRGINGARCGESNSQVGDPDLDEEKRTSPLQRYALEFCPMPEAVAKSIFHRDHKAYFEREQLSKFFSRPWGCKDATRNELVEFIRNYNEKDRMTVIASKRLDLSLNTLRQIFPLPSVGNYVEQREKDYYPDYFQGSKTTTVYDLSTCLHDQTRDRLIFQCFTLHFQEPGSEVNLSMIKQVEVPGPRNWDLYWYRRFYNELGRTQKGMNTINQPFISAHIQIILWWHRNRAEAGLGNEMQDVGKPQSSDVYLAEPLLQGKIGSSVPSTARREVRTSLGSNNLPSSVTTPSSMKRRRNLVAALTNDEDLEPKGEGTDTRARDRCDNCAACTTEICQSHVHGGPSFISRKGRSPKELAGERLVAEELFSRPGSEARQTFSGSGQAFVEGAKDVLKPKFLILNGHMKKLQEEILEKGNQIRNLEIMVRQNRAKWIAERDKAAMLGTKVTNLEAELKQTKTELDEAEASIIAGRKTVIDSESLMQLLATSVEQLNEQVVHLDSRVLKLENTIHNVEDEKSDYLQEIQELKNRVSAQEKAANEAMTDAEEMRRDLEYYKDCLETLAEEETSVELQVDH